MAKKVIRLTKEELHNLITEATNQALLEIDGKTYSRVHNATIQAQKDLLNNIPNSPQGRSNMDVIERGIDLDPRAADSLITPFKTKYLFHCQNLRGAAAITIFDLKQLYELTPQKAILKGDITFNNEPLYGSIIVNLQTNQVQYNYKGKYPHYTLTIDLSKKQLWDELVGELQLSVQSRTV